METSKTKELDSTLFHADLAYYSFVAISQSKDVLISDYLKEQTDYFDFYKDDVRQYIDCQSLDSEIRDWFLNQQDSKLQDRFANYLIDILLNKFRRLYDGTTSWYENVEQDMGRSQGTKEGDIWTENGLFCSSIANLVSRWIYVIKKHVKTFAPELYQQNSYALDRLLPVYDEEGEEIEHPETAEQSAQPDEKSEKETPTKDQILLLHKLGILDLPAIKDLTTENKGKLFARLLNRNVKNVTECIRTCHPTGHKQAADNPYIYENKVNAVNQLLTDVGFFTKL